MKKFYILLISMVILISCSPSPKQMVIVVKKEQSETVLGNRFYVVTKSIYNGEKKVSIIDRAHYILYNVGDTIPEPYSAIR